MIGESCEQALARASPDVAVDFLQDLAERTRRNNPARSTRFARDSKSLEGLHKLPDGFLRVAVKHPRVIPIEEVVLDPCETLPMPAL